MDSDNLDLFSPLSPAECAARISLAASPSSAWFPPQADPSSSEPIIGRIEGLSLRLRRRIFYRSSFQILFTGEMRAAGSGTRITGSFAVPMHVQIFMTVWLVGVVLLGGTMFVTALASYLPGSTIHASGYPWVGLVVPPLMLCVGAGMWLFGRYAARDEPRVITEALARVVGAIEPPPLPKASAS